MPASPRIRLTFTDGERYEDRANEDIWCDSDMRHKPLSEIEIGDQVLPDCPEGDIKIVAAKEVLPYTCRRKESRRTSREE